MPATTSQAQDTTKPAYARLGQTGLQISRVVLGLMSYGSSKWQQWVLDEDKALPIMKRAWDLGINAFDTADAYSNGESERILGAFIKKYNIPREKIVIATKLFFQVLPPEEIGVNSLGRVVPAHVSANQMGLSRKHIFEAVDASLKRLGTNYIDLYQIHRWDPDTPIEETMGALNDLVRAGKVRYIGASSMWAWQFAKAQEVARKNGWATFSSMQNLYNLVYREEERDMLPLCRDQGVGVIAWSPLARGVLAGKGTGDSLRSTTDAARTAWFGGNYSEIEKQVDAGVVEQVRDVAKKRGVNMAVVALAWLLHKPGFTAPIVGVNKPEYLDDMIAATHLKLSPEEIEQLEKPYYPKRVVGHA